MRVKSVHIKAFKRFTELTIDELPSSCRLVVMVGPNGCGKSSLFDAFKTWHWYHGEPGSNNDETYYRKQGVPVVAWGQHVDIDFHTPLPGDRATWKKIFYIRSAYRNQPDFTLSSLSRQGPVFEAPKVAKLIDNDARVEDNYQRLVSRTVDGVYSGHRDELSVAQLREEFIGQVREPMRRVFGDLTLTGLGDPLDQGSFFFDKGVSREFHYKNLSGGEKAAFDLLLDLVLKKTAYDDTVFCIDEPEGHMHARLQGLLLDELFKFTTENSQLWIATHSIGMIRKAKDLQAAHPGEIVFLDLHDVDFDQPAELRPCLVNRDLWLKTLGVALDDLAKLVAPAEVVLCEGRSPSRGDPAREEFDAKCYQRIFSSEYPDTDFVSVGNTTDVQTDRLGLGDALQRLIKGTRVRRVIDRDNKTPEEIADLKSKGVRVLSRRHLEAYLLDDEILRVLCLSVDNEDSVGQLLEAKKAALVASEGRGNDTDDMKSAGGSIYEAAKSILNLTNAGSTAAAFLRDTLAPLVRPETSVYKELKNDIFGD